MTPPENGRRRGSGRTTMEDVAREAGVSRALVSLAMRDAPGVRPATREHILEVARGLGYRHNRVAAELAGKGAGAVGVFVADLHNDVYAEVFDGIRSVLDPAGRRVVVTVGSSDGSRDRASLDGLLEARVGISLAMGLRLTDRDLLERDGLGDLVLATRQVPGILGATSDDVLGARLATTHLLGLGHRRIAFLANPDGDGYRGRREGYEATMEEAGLTAQVVPGSYDVDLVRRAARRLLSGEDRPTAVFAHNDRAAIATLGALADLGLRCPEDVSVVGFDGADAARMPGIELTTVDARAREVGARAAAIALARLDGDAEGAVPVVVPPQLVSRRTAARPARA